MYIYIYEFTSFPCNACLKPSKTCKALAQEHGSGLQKADARDSGPLD